MYRLARRDAAKRRYEQKNEERQTAIKERAHALKEKEKVSIQSIALVSLSYCCAVPLPGFDYVLWGGLNLVLALLLGLRPDQYIFS